MFRLLSILYTLAATVLAGSAVVAALTLGLFDVKSIVLAVLLGAAAAIPVAWVIARRVSAL